jgi:hypothetical protein
MSHRRTLQKKNGNHNVSAGGEAAGSPPLLMVAKHEACFTEIPHMPLNGSSAETKDPCHTVDRWPAAPACICMVKKAEICREYVKS